MVFEMGFPMANVILMKSKSTIFLDLPRLRQRESTKRQRAHISGPSLTNTTQGKIY